MFLLVSWLVIIPISVVVVVKRDQHGDLDYENMQMTTDNDSYDVVSGQGKTTTVKRYGFIIDLVKCVYKETDEAAKDTKCCACFCEADEINIWVFFSCGVHATHFLCLECFFRGLSTAEDFSNFNKLVYKCPFDKCVSTNGIGLQSLKQLFLESCVFYAIEDKNLENIEKLLEQRTGVFEANNAYLAELKQTYQELNRDQSSKFEYKPCPLCHIPVEKEVVGNENECNATYCSNCGCVFCWLCGWFSFGLINTGHEHYWAGDCVKKGDSSFRDGHFAKASYYGRKYLFGSAPYQKPRFFLHVGCENFPYYVAMKDQITSDKYKIEKTLKSYTSHIFCDYWKLVSGKSNEYTYEPPKK